MTALLLPPILSLLLMPFPQETDQAEGLFDAAQTFMSAGKYKEALTDFENIINNYSQSSYAPRALLEVGHYYLEIEGAHENAATYFSRIQNDYPESEQAPAAYIFKARIIDSQGESPPELESAVADLIRMGNLYPNNSWKSGALFLLGKLSMRLRDFEQSLNYFHRLEFAFPQSDYLPPALLLSAKTAYLNGNRGEAVLVLARLQSKFPNTPESKFAASLLRLLKAGMIQGELEVDRTFFGATPKTFSNPADIGIGWDGHIGIKHSRGVFYSDLNGPEAGPDVPDKDLVGFTRGRDGQLYLVYKERIVDQATGETVFGGLNWTSGTLKDIRAAAVDGFGRLFLVDNGVRDVAAFSREGTFLKVLGLNRPKLVRAFQDEIWVLASDGQSFIRYGGSLAHPDSPLSGLDDVEDFQFDPLGHVYVLHQRGYQVTVFDRKGVSLLSMNLKSGDFPLKQAQAIGADASGAVYLSDRRGGAVFRFQ